MSMRAAKGLGVVVLAVFGWVLIYLSVVHSWTLLTAREAVVGPTGLILHEAVRTAPALVYFYVVGIVMAQYFGIALGARWAALAPSAAMALEALAEHQIFLGGIDLLAVAVLGVNYLLPIALGVAGALTVRLWQKPKGGAVAT
jgi:hypothetical protein